LIAIGTPASGGSAAPPRSSRHAIGLGVSALRAERKIGVQFGISERDAVVEFARQLPAEIFFAVQRLRDDAMVQSALPLALAGVIGSITLGTRKNGGAGSGAAASASSMMSQGTPRRRAAACQGLRRNRASAPSADFRSVQLVELGNGKRESNRAGCGTSRLRLQPVPDAPAPRLSARLRVRFSSMPAYEGTRAVTGAFRRVFRGHVVVTSASNAAANSRNLPSSVTNFFAVEYTGQRGASPVPGRLMRYWSFRFAGPFTMQPITGHGHGFDASYFTSIQAWCHVCIPVHARPIPGTWCWWCGRSRAAVTLAQTSAGRALAAIRRTHKPLRGDRRPAQRQRKMRIVSAMPSFSSMPMAVAPDRATCHTSVKPRCAAGSVRARDRYTRIKFCGFETLQEMMICSCVSPIQGRARRSKAESTMHSVQNASEGFAQVAVGILLHLGITRVPGSASRHSRAMRTALRCRARFYSSRRQHQREISSCGPRDRRRGIAGLSLFPQPGLAGTDGWAARLTNTAFSPRTGTGFGAIPRMLFLGMVMMRFITCARTHSVPGYLIVRSGEGTSIVAAFSFASYVLMSADNVRHAE